MCGVSGVRWIRSEGVFEIAGRWRSKNDPRAGVCYPVAQHTSTSSTPRFSGKGHGESSTNVYGPLHGGCAIVAKSFVKSTKNEGPGSYGSPFGNPLPSALALMASAYGFRIIYIGDAPPLASLTL